MKFSKKRFNENAPKDIKKKINKHIDVLDGMEVKIDGDFGEIEYTFNGEGFLLYPVFKEWCKEDAE